MRVSKYCFLLTLLAASFLLKADAQNAIVTENLLTGNPISEWGVPDFRDTRINGFATEISTNKGGIVRFKIHSQSSAGFQLRIYRLGYYNGNGARLIADLGNIAGTAQPAGILTTATGLYDCRNWSQSAQWTIPTTAVSGVYIAKLTRTGGGSNHIVFVVRDDAGNSDVVMQTTDATWQAYNGYGGNYFYGGTTPGYTNGRAVKVSYNRPIFPYNAGFLTNNRQADWYMNAEYPMIRWLERNGYNLSYITCVDVARTPSILLSHKIFISAGHDEYWSLEQRNNVEAARNSGVHCAFFTGNEVYWKTRWEADGAGNNFHTLVCYKEGTMGDGTVDESACGTKCDPLPTVWTGLWRTGGAYDAGRPENGLTGQISWNETNDAITVPFAYKNHRIWRNTTVASLLAGQTATFSPNTLGYEWDWEQYTSSYPEGRMKVSQTTIGARTHHLSLYRHSSGALVFGAGTVQWSWGLDANHAGGVGNVASNDMQQATLNLFADMGVQPGSKQADLDPASASTDITAPVTTLSFPMHNAQLLQNVPVVISGTSSDNAMVTVVEVSVDGGLTWTPATGTTQWTFSWTPAQTGSITIKVRAWDDTGNKETAGNAPSANAVTVAVNATSLTICPCTLFTPAQTQQPPTGSASNDGSGIVLGMRFRPLENGYITGLRFYKAANNTGTHTGLLYSRTGSLLAQAPYSGETASGWQTVSLTTPVFVKKDTTYVVAYHSSSGYYSATVGFFQQELLQAPLRGLANGVDGSNGIYSYSATPVFPTTAATQTNYWVDVRYSCASNTWLGTSSTAWENPLNWSCGMVPSTQSIVVIPAGTPFSPEIRSNVIVRSLTISAAATLTVATGFSFRAEIPSN